MRVPRGASLAEPSGSVILTSSDMAVFPSAERGKRPARALEARLPRGQGWQVGVVLQAGTCCVQTSNATLHTGASNAPPMRPPSLNVTSTVPFTDVAETDVTVTVPPVGVGALGTSPQLASSLVAAAAAKVT